MMRTFLVVGSALILAACGGVDRTGSPTAAALVESAMLLNPVEQGVAGDYRIGPTDLLKVTVFQVPDLSFDEIRVDAAGNIQMPLIGSVRAADRTPAQLSVDIQELLGTRYLRNPQVTVTVAEAASQKVTVDGAVTRPGVYLMRGRTTLLQAVAMAEGASRGARLSSVALFRTIDNRRAVAVFDLAAIRAGEAEDPVIKGDDIVVVDSSPYYAAFREIAAIVPAIGAFAYF